MRLALAAAALSGLAACASAPVPTPAPGTLSFVEVAAPAPERAPARSLAGAFGAALNEVRARAGLGHLRPHPRLAAAAEAHAADMASNGYVSHHGRDGSTAHQRAVAAGCGAGYLSENIAWGQDSHHKAFRGWMESPPHHRNMMGRPYGVYGLGEAGGHWVVMFADGC